MLPKSEHMRTAADHGAESAGKDLQSADGYAILSTIVPEEARITLPAAGECHSMEKKGAAQCEKQNIRFACPAHPR